MMSSRSVFVLANADHLAAAAGAERAVRLDHDFDALKMLWQISLGGLAGLRSFGFFRVAFSASSLAASNMP